MEAGEKINMEDILMMYVWIPRYSYTIKQPYGKQEAGREDIPTASNPGEVDVKFITVDDKDEGTAQYTKDLAKEWYTPPGFTFGEKELSGVWIGKFETGSVRGNDPQDVNPETSKNLVAIKPNITSWRYIRVSTLEEISMGITDVENIYGFDQTTYDAHATKNTEWALITYLSQSKYGKYGNSLYTGENRQVYMNNCSRYLTGCSSGQRLASSQETCLYQYNDLTIQGEGTGYAGAGASTTGNIYGIYDASGGAWEYVMGNYAVDGVKYTGFSQTSNSGYTGAVREATDMYVGRDWKEDKYYDFYNINTCTVDKINANPYKGHALNEIIDCQQEKMIRSWNPWFLRGGHLESDSIVGIFALNREAGHSHGSFSFRIILTPNN